MLIVLKQNAGTEEIAEVESKVRELGYTPYAIRGAQRVAIGVLGNENQIDSTPLEGLDCVIEIIHVSKPYKLVGREFRGGLSSVSIGEVKVGGGAVVVMAGPCAVESEDQIVSTALAVKAAGASVLRGGAFKPRTSPYAFQGHGVDGLKMLAAARQASGLPFVTEIIDEHSLEAGVEWADALQIGARNMQNFALLRHVGQTSKPIVLKRGISATVKDMLMSAEYIMSEGNERVILCERGIRTFSDASRNTLDICAVPYIRSESHLPVIVDPSHSMGIADKVTAIARAGVAVGSDGLMVEVHPDPKRARSDGAQSLSFGQFETLMGEVRKIAGAIGKTI